MSSITPGWLPREPRDSQAPRAYAWESGSPAPALAGVSTQICFHLPSFLSFYRETSDEGLEAARAGSPPTTEPPLLMLSGFLPATQAPGLSLQQGRTFRAGPFLAKPAEKRVLQEGKKCDPHRSVVPERTPLGCRALCNNSKDCFLSEAVLLTGLTDDRFSSPTQTKDPERDL